MQLVREMVEREGGREGGRKGGRGECVHMQLVREMVEREGGREGEGSAFICNWYVKWWCAIFRVYTSVKNQCNLRHGICTYHELWHGMVCKPAPDGSQPHSSPHTQSLTSIFLYRP